MTNKELGIIFQNADENTDENSDGNGKKSFNDQISSVHEGKKPYRCDNCEISFSSRNDLLGHNLSVHKKKKPYKCETCTYDFSTKTHLYNHIAAIHQGQESNDKAPNLKKRKASENVEGEEESRLRKISCHLCDKSFARNQNLVYHVATVHEEKKPFKCDKCGNCFGTKQNMESHIKVMHEKIKIKKEVPCPICNQILSRKDALAKHLRTMHKS